MEVARKGATVINGRLTEVRASNLARVMACRGQPFFDVEEQPEGEPAREGTAFGEYVQAVLETGLPPTTPHAKNGFAFDDDMAFYSKGIVANIQKHAVSQVLCEQEILWVTRSGVVIRGHYDASFIGHEAKLYVDDNKYGWVIVEAPENWQLLAYAIGEVIRRGIAFEKIVMRIHQPRPHHEDGVTRAWEITYHELLQYKEMIEQRMDEISNGDRRITTGPKCKYCPAAAEKCPALSKAFFAGVEHAQEFLQDKISDEELSRQLDLASRIAEIVKIKKSSLEALAVNRIASGKVIPNYIAEASYGDRQWKNDLSPETVRILTGVDIVEKTKMSPAKAEKAGVPKEFVKSMVTRYFKGQNIVRKDTGQVANKVFGTEAPK